MHKHLLLLSAISISLLAQSPAQPVLNNQRIYDLITTGVSTPEVLRIIATASKIDFDLRPISTDSLMKAGVSEDVIKAMAARESGQLLPISGQIAAPPGPFSTESRLPVLNNVSKSSSDGVAISEHRDMAPVSPVQAKVRSGSLGFGQIPKNSAFYIEPNDGFDTFLTAALDKKHVPLAVVADRARADYIVESANDSQKAGWARIIALGQTGSNEEASVRIVNVATGNVVWAYAVHKRNSFHGKQSSAEACAKHLKSVVR